MLIVSTGNTAVGHDDASPVRGGWIEPAEDQKRQDGQVPRSFHHEFHLPPVKGRLLLSTNYEDVRTAE